MSQKIKVGIIDDSNEKILGIYSKLILPVSAIPQEKKIIFEQYKFEPITLSLHSDKDKIIRQIRNEKIDCLIIDYKLSSYDTIPYDGTELAEYITNFIVDFPIFILTSFEEDLFTNTLFDSYQVFDFNRYTNEPLETIELNYKMIQQTTNYKKKIQIYKSKLLDLIPQAGTDAVVDDYIVELNRKIEGSLFCENLLSNRTQRVLMSSKLDEFIDKLESIVDDE